MDKILAAAFCTLILSSNAHATSQPVNGRTPLPADSTDYFCYLAQSGLNNGLKMKASKTPLTAEQIELQRVAQIQMIYFLGRISTEPEIEAVTKLNVETQKMIQTRHQDKSFDDLKPCHERIARYASMIETNAPPVTSSER